LTQAAGVSTKGGSQRSVPVTDPVRVLLVDPDIVGGSALAKAIDMDPELAVVGLCRNPRRTKAEVGHCRPDLVAIRLGLDDERCVMVLNEIAAGLASPCVVVLGAPVHGADATRDARLLKNRIRAVAEASFGISPVPEAPPVHAESGSPLH
jgi:chemotaxis response regulator CheB